MDANILENAVAIPDQTQIIQYTHTAKSKCKCTDELFAAAGHVKYMEQHYRVFTTSNVPSFVCIDIGSHQVHLLRQTHGNLHMMVKMRRLLHAAMLMCFS